MGKKEKVEQQSLADMIGAIEWEDAEIGIHLLQESASPPPERSLVASIAQTGVLIPILVLDPREGDSGASDGYRVIDGNRRIAAAKEAGLTSMPARVARGEHGAAAAFAFTLIANDHRSSNPIAEWDAISGLRKAWGMDEQSIARILGISVSTVRKRERLSNLRPFWERKFRAGGLSTSIAESIAKLPDKDQERLIKGLKGAGGKVTHEMIREVKEARRALYAPSLLSEEMMIRPEGGAPIKGESGGEANEGARILVAVGKLRAEIIAGGDDLQVRMDRHLAELESVGYRMGGSNG